MKPKVLLLGSTGKMGRALEDAFKNDYKVIGKNSKDFNAEDFSQVENLVKKNKPDILINTVAVLGIDPCENEPEKAFRLNSLYPKLLAELSVRHKFLLVHFSTDAVFSDRKSGFYVETDTPRPLNIYGLTKYGGDCFIQARASSYYIFRTGVLFGESLKKTQFVEKMLEKIKNGEKTLRISSDIISSPTYSRDVARQIKLVIDKKYPFGVYHISNSGRASLYELMNEIVRNLNIRVSVKKSSFRDFPFVGIKNTCTPIRSSKLSPLRHWKEGVKEYCCCIKDKL